MTQVLQVSRSGYYAWRRRKPSARKMANRQLLEKIRIIHQESQETYGSPRVTQALRQQGVTCGENRVARLMRQAGLQGKQVQAYKSTTRRNARHPVAPNLLKRAFTAEQPDQIWLADMTYIPTQEGWLYLAAVMDMFSRRIVGWAMDEHMTEALTLTALQMALETRQPLAGLIHHSDQGSQYTSRIYQELLKSHGLRASMNGVGTWYDNAPMESFFGTLKAECVHHIDYATRRAARTSIFGYIESFYNRRRLHSSLGYMSPEAYELAAVQQPMVRLV